MVRINKIDMQDVHKTNFYLFMGFYPKYEAKDYIV